MRILFWGTPDFATPSLRALLGEGFEVCGVVTQPDKPAGRRRALQESPVKRIAREEGLPVFQPETARDEEFREMLALMAPDLSVVVAYGHILPRSVIELPRLGTVNIHASLLPALRGAAPIQAALREGLSQTGISIMQMVPALDAGPVLLRAIAPVADDETYGELSARLAELGALALIEALALLELGRARAEPQDDSLATYASKVTRETTRLRWSDGCDEVANAIRAYDPRPGAWGVLDGNDVKLFGARRVHERGGQPGEVLEASAEGLVVACGSGAVRIAEVQPAGTRRMSSIDWHRGRGVAIGAILG